MTNKLNKTYELLTEKHKMNTRRDLVRGIEWEEERKGNK